LFVTYYISKSQIHPFTFQLQHLATNECAPAMLSAADGCEVLLADAVGRVITRYVGDTMLS